MRLKGNVNHSVCRWCYGKIELADLCAAAVEMGIQSVELLGPDAWPMLIARGLICGMTPSHPIEKGLNRTENHESCLAKIRDAIDATAAAGFPNVICFSGNREGMDDEQAIENCAVALKQVVALAESRGVTLCMELLNSKSHPDYHCDRTAWGVALAEKVGSPRFKLLYDIYHMQRMEGEIIETIRGGIEHIGHFHTGGCPGRNEIDETQELNYPAIMRAIVETGYTGLVGHEFIPTRDPLTSLRQGVEICDV